MQVGSPHQYNNRIYLGKIGALKQEDIEKEVKLFGQVKDILMKDTYCFIEYSTDEEAKAALLNLDGRSISGQRVSAEFAKPRQGDPAYFKLHPRIYIGRLMNSNKAEVNSLFSQFGEITDTLVKNDYAFVEYTSPEASQQAINQMNGYEYNNQKLIVQQARPKDYEDQTSTTRLYVGRINKDIKKHDLVQNFGVYGEIVDLVLKDEFAFIEYSTITSATRAINELNNVKIAGCKITVEEARPREGESQMPLRMKKAPNNQLYPLNPPTIQTKMTLGSKEIQRIKMKRKSPRRSLSRSRSKSRERN